MSRDWMRRLPNGKPISALGFGCASLWAKANFDAARAQEILAAARDGGINHFDTAPSYGGGLGEERLGQFLRNANPDDFVISTKIGSNVLDGRLVRSFDREIVAKSFSGSLKRLGVERVDILYLHGPRKDDLSNELLRFLEDEKARGRIGYSGLESGDLGSFAQMGQTVIDVAMLHYNVSDTSAESLIEQLHAEGKLIVSGTSLAQSKFAFDTFAPTSAAKVWYLLRMLKNDPLFWSGKAAMARELGKFRSSPHATALGFVTGHPLITSSLFGSGDPKHVQQNAESGHQPLNSDERKRLSAATSMARREERRSK